MPNTAAFATGSATWALLAAVLATAAHAEVGIAPRLPHSETLARGE